MTAGRQTAEKIEGRGIKSIKVAGRILQVMIDKAESVALSDIAELAEINSSQAHTYLTSFRRIGLVEQDFHLGHYRIGPVAMQLAVGRLSSSVWQSACLDAVAQLSEELGMMASMVAWGPKGPTVLQVHDGGSNLNLNMRPGMVFSMIGTASGRVFAAFGDNPLIDDMVDREIKALRKKQGTDSQLTKAQFQATLSNIRKEGLAWAGGAPIPNVNAVCVPIFGPQSEIRFTLSLIEFAHLMPVGTLDAAVLRLQGVAAEISEMSKEGGAFDAKHN